MQADTHLVGQAPASSADAIYRKVAWRIIPLLFLCYIAAYLDRINIGFAQAAIRTDLAFSSTAFSFGASVFFVGYLLFEVPSNMYLERVGTRRTLARIMVLWGLISAATMFVRTPGQFYVLRFLLGSAEAGFFPGVVLYLTYWFPPQRRAKIVALFMLPVAFAGFFGAPVSGLIMQTLDGANGWHGWQWMFLLEAIPSVLLGAVVLKYLTDRPRDAHRWLSPREIEQIEGDLARSSVPAASHEHGVWRTLLTDWRIYILILGYSALNASVIGIGIWMPQILREASHDTSSVFIGMLTAIPYAAGGIGMLLFGIGSDYLAERRRFCSGLLALTGLGFVFAGLMAHNLPMLLVALSLVLVGNLSGYPVFWALTSQHFRTSTAAVGVALVSSIGQLGSFASPMIINASKHLTGSVSDGLDAIAGLLFVAAVAILLSFRGVRGGNAPAH
ncbi:MFS transporter [Pandoraea terrigena]|uniref:Major facilitator transporter n=1 Tax=Pandoraea terrigena TaxID=2508292 RepID=A0A5E4UBK9_9BURK|nr:MFS transporter [Pandoraea terrigena]VVD97437.1 major facilitator transporter [Pandoraea terrigena]